jgi:signal transduction histidine kinase
VLTAAQGEMAVLARTFERMSGALRDLYANLESKVEDRTRQLVEVNQELEQQRAALEKQSRELEKANRLKSEFLASVSHELRTPLTSVLAFNELLRDGSAGPLTPVQQEYLEDIQESGERLYAHINDLLDLAKMEAGRIILRQETVLLAEIIDRVVRRMQPLAARKGLSLGEACHDRLQLVYADLSKVEQILLNLVSNAIKFTDTGQVEIGSRCIENGEVTIWVRDTGIGIHPEHFELIFEKFRQIDGSSTRTHKGTGLGLALAKHLVEMHGGRIWLESKPGVGSVFYFTLPASSVLSQDLA